MTTGVSWWSTTAPNPTTHTHIHTQPEIKPSPLTSQWISPLSSSVLSHPTFLHWLYRVFAVLLLTGYAQLFLLRKRKLRLRLVHAGADGNGTGACGRVHLAIKRGRDAEVKNGAGDSGLLGMDAVLTHACALAVAVRWRWSGRVAAAIC